MKAVQMMRLMRQKRVDNPHSFGYTCDRLEKERAGMVSLSKSQLSKVKIKGFKSIRDQEVEFRRINVVIGSNGAGKSNLISAFSFLEEILKKRLSLYSSQRGTEALLYCGRKQTQSISMEFVFGNENSYGFELVPTDDGRLIFSREFYGFSTTHTSILQEAHAESVWERGVRNNITPYVLPILQDNSWRVYHFNDTSPEASIKQTQSIANNAFLQNDAGNLAAFLYRLKMGFPDGYRKIVDYIQLVAPYFGDFYLSPQEGYGEQIRLRWMEKGQDTVLNAAQFSDGTLRFICLAVLLLQPKEMRPSTIIVDEPEIGLHPYAVNVFSEMVRQASLDSQILLSTQSADLLSNFEPEDVLVANRNGNGSEFSHLSTGELQGWLEDYSLGELWQKNIFGGRLAR